MRGTTAWLLAALLLAGCSSHKGELGDSDPDYRRDAIVRVTNEGDRTDNPAVAARLLNDPDPLVRAQSAIKLGQSRDPEAVQFLVQALSDKDEQVRWDTLIALERIGDHSSSAKVVEMISKEENPNVKRVAARYLGEAGDPASVPALIEAVGDPEYRVSAAAADALHALTHQDFGRDKAKWKAWFGGPPPAGEKK